ncbi:MAG TPA: ABC transporter permease [Thermoanaerobaculia bacterium]|nr:ABC transporter permease [Thermoanaerobaculia bacterium]
MIAVWSLWRRELVRFFRQPSRVAGAAGSPLLFWLFIGSGLSGSFHPPGSAAIGYLEYFFPGTVTLVVLFAAIFSTISVIEDRREGFLQGVLAAPVPRAAIAAGKVFGGATLAWIQGAAFLLLAPFAGIHLDIPSVLAAAGVLALLSLALTAIGFACAWSVDSVQGFHAVMNLLLVPLWLLSGAVFPLTGAPVWLSALMRIDPLTYGVASLRWTFYGSAAQLGEGIPGPVAALAILIALGLLAFAADLWVMRRGRVE